MQKAIDELWKFTGELFETDIVDETLLESGIAVNMGIVQAKWKQKVDAVLTEGKLLIPEVSYMQTGSRMGIHSEYLGHILTEMQYLQNAYPDAKW